MRTSIYTLHCFHLDIIRCTVWMYFGFNFSFQDLAELMIERGIDVFYETIRRWIDSFGSAYAKRIKSRSESPSSVWHLDEVCAKIYGKMVYLWKAVDDERTVLGVIIQRGQNTKAATPPITETLQEPKYKSALRRLVLSPAHWQTT